MYATQIGKSEKQWNSREAAYKAAHTASTQGWRYVNILLDGDLECRVITREEGGIHIWTPNLASKWECSRFFGQVNEMNDVVFRAA